MVDQLFFQFEPFFSFMKLWNESLNSDSQQFDNQYQESEQSPLT